MHQTDHLFLVYCIISMHNFMNKLNNFHKIFTPYVLKMQSSITMKRHLLSCEKNSSAEVKKVQLFLIIVIITKISFAGTVKRNLIHLERHVTAWISWENSVPEQKLDSLKFSQTLFTIILRYIKIFQRIIMAIFSNFLIFTNDLSKQSS